MNETSDDAQLIALVANGDDRACTALFRRHHQRAVAEARSRARNLDAAEDAAAAAFQSVFRALRDGREVEHFRSYLLTAVRNAVISQARSKSSTEIPSDDPVDGIDGSLAGVADQRLGRAMTLAFDALPARQQAALWSSEVEDASNAEIGERLDIKANAVAALTMRARRTLRDVYIAEMTGGADIHEWVLERIDAMPLSVENQLVVDFHLGDCDGCAALVGERRPVRTAGLVGSALLLGGVRPPATSSPPLVGKTAAGTTRTVTRIRTLASHPAAWVGIAAVAGVAALAVATTFASDGPVGNDVPSVDADLEIDPGARITDPNPGGEPASDDHVQTSEPEPSAEPIDPPTSSPSTTALAPESSTALSTTTVATGLSTPVGGAGAATTTTTTTRANTPPTDAPPPATTAAPTTSVSASTTTSPTTTTTTTTTTTIPSTTTTTTSTSSTTTTTTTSSTTTTTTTTTTTVACGQQNPPTC